MPERRKEKKKMKFRASLRELKIIIDPNGLIVDITLKYNFIDKIGKKDAKSHTFFRSFYTLIRVRDLHVLVSDNR